MPKACEHHDCEYEVCSHAPSTTLTALGVVEKRLESYPLVSLNTQDLLLLDIARSLREQTRIAKEGFEFSQSLAGLMVDTAGQS